MTSSSLPLIVPVTQSVTDAGIDDLPEHLKPQLSAGIASLASGTRVAIGVGSRGIDRLTEIVAITVQHLRNLGADPFVVPAMGSHGGSTAAGQQAVLERRGVDEKSVGAPVVSSMETVQLGMTDKGMPVYCDANVAAADAVLVINRVKPHTAFRGPVESGLLKMLAVGFGKKRGAATIHGWGVGSAMPAAAAVAVQKLPLLGGIGIVEDGRHQPCIVELIGAERLFQREAELLTIATDHLPRIPFASLDALVLQQIGKEISGTGMDLNVVGMWRRKGGKPEPDYHAIAALDLTEASHGNAIGVGYADVITERLRDAVDKKMTWSNCLTSCNYSAAKLPIALPTDREVIEAIMPRAAPEQARLVIAPSTRQLYDLWVSDALLGEVVTSSSLLIAGPSRQIPFDETGNLSLGDRS